jgi:hypothetical protein
MLDDLVRRLYGSNAAPLLRLPINVLKTDVFRTSWAPITGHRLHLFSKK